MPKCSLYCWWASLALLVEGCAWVHQTATLKLDPQIAPSAVGQGTTIAVRVLDKRKTRIIGYRGVDSKNASITTDQDVPALFQQNIMQGLARKGFNAVAYGESAPHRLTVEIRQIEYTTDMEFWKGIVQVQATLRALSTKDGTFFDRTYLGARRDTVLEAPSAKTNEQLINGAISDAVQYLLEDERLVLFLTN
jgi:uncharacterized lipoprotein YajG